MGDRRVAVVGAGPAGLAALRALTAAGLDATAFERGRRVGGVWTLEDRPTAAYRSLHLIASAACEGRGGRDVAVTRGGAIQLAVARHLPTVVDRVVARTLRRRVAAGELDEAPIAAGVRRRHGRS